MDQWILPQAVSPPYSGAACVGSLLNICVLILLTNMSVLLLLLLLMMMITMCGYIAESISMCRRVTVSVECRATFILTDLTNDHGILRLIVTHCTRHIMDND